MPETERFFVYLLINNSCREVFFGVTVSFQLLGESLPEEIRHWRIGYDEIISPVIIEEDLTQEEALAVLQEVQEKAIRDPQGRTILRNRDLPFAPAGKTPLANS